MGTISGVVRESLTNNPIQRLIRCYRYDTGQFAGESVSSPSTGAYSISGLADGVLHSVVMHDAVVTPGDPYFNSNVLLMRFNGNYINEVDGVAASNTGGGVGIESASPLYGSGSLSLSGGAYLSIPYSWGAPVIGSGDYTCEFSFKASSVSSPSFQGILNIGDYSTGLLVRLKSDSIEVFETGSSRSFSNAFSAGQKYDCSISRVSGVLRAFVDGAQIGTGINSSASIPALPITIGTAAHNTAEYFGGVIDEVRISAIGRHSASHAVSIPHLGRNQLSPLTGKSVVLDYVMPV